MATCAFDDIFLQDFELKEEKQVLSSLSTSLTTCSVGQDVVDAVEEYDIARSNLQERIDTVLETLHTESAHTHTDAR